MKSFLLLFICCCVVLTSVAQGNQKVRGSYDSASFDDLVRDLEQQTSCKIYFNKSWTDSLKITYKTSDENVEDVLKHALESHGNFNIFIKGNDIYVTLERAISPSLPPGFFNSSNEPPQSADFDYSDFITKREKQQKLEEQIYVIGKRSEGLTGEATITGQVKDIDTGEPIIGASVYIQNPMIGTATDQFGYFTLTLSKGNKTINIKSIGMKATQRNVLIFGNGRLDIEMSEDIIPLKEVIVESDQGLMVSDLKMGVEKLDMKAMKQIPLVLGETDILKVMLTLPGVQSSGEGTVGMSVRGGSTNQNMILYNDAIVYNPSHLFGFFSAFNPDVLKNVELLKSGIPAEYGGRLSSFLDVQTKEGNLNKLSGSFGISPITGRISLEGPIIKDKTTFVVGARSTYSNWLLKQIDYQSLNKSQANFYDVTATLTHKINDNNQLYLSSYISHDDFSLASDTVYNYSDRNGSIKWKHVFNNKLYGVATGSISQYQYGITSDQNPFDAFKMNFSIQQIAGKLDFNYFPNAKHHITGGLSAINYDLSPGKLVPLGDESLLVERELESEKGLETAIYLGDQYEVNSKLAIYGGIRYSRFYSFGPKTGYIYDPNGPKEVSNIIDTIYYKSGNKIAQYGGVEPRVSLRYLLPGNSSIKFSYNRMYQYIQMLSNTAAINPTDIWKLSDQNVHPQSADQWSVGYYRNILKNVVEASVEVYYKDIKNTVDYKGQAELLLNPQLETDLLKASGRAYGIEILLKKSVGRLNGWISYTFSRSLLKSEGKFKQEVINNGDYYPNYLDVPHSANLIGNYRFNRRINVSLNAVYRTGRPVTLPVAKYDLEGVERVFYSERNKFRIPDYFRLDLSVNIEGNHKVKKLIHSSWTVAVYNVLGRANAYSVFYKNEDSQIKGYKLSVFPRPIPTITYNLKF